MRYLFRAEILIAVRLMTFFFLGWKQWRGPGRLLRTLISAVSGTNLPSENLPDLNF
jgi:hypothetical protein